MFYLFGSRLRTFPVLRWSAVFGLALAIAIGSTSQPASPSFASDFTITFEESIPVPETVRNQYCNDPDTNQGVEFRRPVSIFEPEFGTASPIHAAAEIPGQDDVNPHGGAISIVFTAGQSHVGVKVGLMEATTSPIRAFLRAYSDPEGGPGTKLTPDPDPSVDLGTVPDGIIHDLAFNMPGDTPSIRRIEIEFLESDGDAGWEVLDDLTYSAVGPTCVTDAIAPSVDILEPNGSQTYYNSQVPLHFRAQDDGSGIARIEVASYDASGTLLGSGYYCGGYSFPRTCPGYPDTLNLEASYYTYMHRETRVIRVTATDFSGKTGGDTETVNLVLPDPTFNLWTMAVELTQGIQGSVPVSMESRSSFATQATQDGYIPVIANKRTVVRVYPGVEGTTNPVVGARATLSCYTFLGANLAGSTPCDGPLGAEPVTEEITADPANNNDLKTLREDTSLSWNFVLPSEWTGPGGPRYLVAIVQPPLNMAECGSYTSGCDDGANFFILTVQDFLETAPLIVKPHFACVRRQSGVPRETCDTLADTAAEALDVAQWLLTGRDWDGDGLLDPYFNVVMPLADGAVGVDIRAPVINDYRDGDLSTSNGVMDDDKMEDYLSDLCDEFNLDFWEIFTDPGELVAEAYPPNLRYLAFVPPPTGPSGKAYYEDPCGVTKIDLRPVRIGDGTNAPENDYCDGCADDSRFVLHWDEPTLSHETGHTFDIQHASCDHNEGVGDEDCEPAPDEFPCPHGGICLSNLNMNEPYGFNTFNMAVLPPNNGTTMHTHDYMSYGSLPTWTSAHTYRRLFFKLRDWLSASLPGPQDSASVADTASQLALPMLYVSGKITPAGDAGSFTTVYLLPQQTVFKEGSGNYSLELLDSTGAVLSRRRFVPEQSAEAGPGSWYFHEILGFHPDTARMVLKNGDQVIAERLRSTAAPTVQVLSPASGDTWNQNLRTVTWQGTDGDGDALVYTVQYSPDQGDTWTTLGLNVTETSLQVSPALLPASGAMNARIRVYASDGINSAYDDSEPFTVNGKPPVVRIQTPASGAAYLEGALVDLVGSGIDVEDGGLEGAALTWASDLDGNLGSGQNLQTRSLSPGLHTLTLTGEDSNGRTASTSIEIEVLAAPNRQPFAAAGADRFALVGSPVQLDGVASFDPDEDPLLYSWRFVSAPQGYETEAIAGLDTANPSFTADLPGEYVLELVVRDGEVNSFPDLVVIRAAESILYSPLIRR